MYFIWGNVFSFKQYCQVLITIFEHMILIGCTHCLEGIYRILFSFLSWYWPVSTSLHFGLITCCGRLGRSSATTQLSGFWNMEVSFALVLRFPPSPHPPKKNKPPSLLAPGKYICCTSVWEWRSYFLFWLLTAQLGKTRDSNHISCWNDVTTV